MIIINNKYDEMKESMGRLFINAQMLSSKEDDSGKTGFISALLMGILDIIVLSVIGVIIFKIIVCE